MNPPDLSKDSNLDLLARLQRHPELLAQVVALLDEVENRAGKLNTGDEAEGAIVERVRKLGRLSLVQWAQERHEVVQPAPIPGLLRRGAKKKWRGTRRLGASS